MLRLLWLRACAVGLVSLLLLLAAPPVSAEPLPESQGCVPDPVLCPERLYFGLSAPGLPYDYTAFDSLVSRVGKSPSIEHFFHSWTAPLNGSVFTSIASLGRLPMVSWEPYDFHDPGVDRFPLREVAAGRFDHQLRVDAAAIRESGTTVAVRLAHEMNGDWYPWGVGVNGNTPADFVAMYRHVVDVFREEGAMNVIWVWSPNLVDFSLAPLAEFYPGADYVDWVGLSGYLDEPGERYGPLYRSTLAELDVIAPTTPILVAEAAVFPSAERPEMIADLFAGLLSTPRMVGFVWFNHDTRQRWSLDSDPGSLAAFSERVASPWFSSAGDVSPVPLPPVALGVPLVSGSPRGGQVLQVSPPRWRTASAGPVSLSGAWYRCRDLSTASCVRTPAAGLGYRLGLSDANVVLRYRATASTSVGSSSVWSLPSGRVLVTPGKPKVPALQARPRAVRVSFPPVPPGATHWRLRVNGVAKPLVVSSARVYWLTGLVNGRSYRWSLEAVASSGAALVASPAVSGAMVPMPVPARPKVRQHDSRVTFTFPTPPRGASHWRVTLDRRVVVLSRSKRTWTVPVARGRHSWSVVAVAGGSLSQPVSGSFRR